MKKLFYKLCAALVIGAISIYVSNIIYTKYFYKNDLELFDAKMLLKLDSLQFNSDVLYFAESSNGTTANSDTCLLSISQMMDTLSPLKINAVDHGAIHAKTYLNLIKHINSNALVKTIVVTLNARSFGSPWINSKLETNLSQSNVMYESIPPIFKRIKLTFNAFDNKSVQFRDYLNEQNWSKSKLNVPEEFPYKTIRQWDNAMGNGTYLLPNGDWDIPKITLACHYIKTYAFSIDTINNPRIKDFDEIVTVANQKNLKLIFHLLAENVQYADSLVGKELHNIMHENKQLLINRYIKKGVIMVNSFELVNGKDFIDQDWTTEHYNQNGRWILAKNVLKQIK
ncbi:MAG: hypothetical protein K9G64_05505 [Bacteroidia bacterium]|nr:hypothetical protein [Bacteroidia bacterium]